MPRFVAGLASLFAEADVRDLDAALKRRAAVAVRRTYTARCSVNGDRYQCVGDVALSGTHSMIDRLSLGGKELTRLQLRNGAVTRQGMTARTAGGDAIERIELPQRGKPGTVIVTVVEDFSPCAPHWRAVIGAGCPLRARVRATLGLPPMNACCGPRNSVLAAADAVVAEVVPAQAAGFVAPCAACHRTAERSPPNFLAGDAQRIRASLAVRAADVRTSFYVAIARDITREGADAAAERVAWRQPVDAGSTRSLGVRVAGDGCRVVTCRVRASAQPCRNARARL